MDVVLRHRDSQGDGRLGAWELPEALRATQSRSLHRAPRCPRASILEMRKDHEEQLQQLKLLKDREIDAVTSATSHTR